MEKLQPDTPQMKIWHMRIAFWILKATNTHSEYVIVTDFPQQQWLHISGSMLSYTYRRLSFVYRLNTLQ